jgi:hypothetical protein
MKTKNLHIYPKTVADRDRLAEEYRSIGFHVETSEGKLTVFTLPKKIVKEKKPFRKPRRERD